MRRILCFLCLCMTSLLVCGWENTDDLISQNEDSVVLDEIQEEGVKLDSLGQKLEILEYNFDMPKAECFSEQAAKEIQKWQEEELSVFWQEVENQTQVEDDRFREIKSDPDEEKQIWWGPGLYHVEYSVYECNGQISFFKREYQLYTIGAHELSDDSSVIFDGNTGEMITSDQLLNRLIGEGDKKRIYLAQYLIEQLAKESGWHKDYRDEVVYEMLFRPECYVKDDTLVVFFDTYDIATYPAGDIFLEVPLRLLDHLEEEIQDKAAAGEWIQKLHQPGGYNQYLVELFEGKMIRADLDGDGRKENICLPVRENAGDVEETAVTVNGKRVIFPLDEGITGGAVALVDMDREDGEYELAVRSYRKGSEPVTVFFGYYDGAFKEVARVDFGIDRESTNTGEACMRGDGWVWGNHDLVEVPKKIENLDEIKKEGSRLDSFYREALLLEYDFDMPKVAGLSKQAAEKIKQWQADELDAFMQEMEEQALLADSDCLERLADPDEEKRGWGVSGIYSVKYTVFQSTGIISFLKEKYQCYGGGAHGTTTHTGIVFDSSTGEVLPIDFFLDEEENGRIALAQYLIEQVDEKSLWDDYREGIVHKAVFDPQYYVEGDHMVFLFSQEELGAYAYGPIFLEIPLGEKREVKDKKAIEKWDEELQIPGKANRYLVEIPVGEGVTVDLDGDGREEEVSYPEEKFVRENTSTEITVMIDGKEFRLAADENMVRESIGLVDIDCEDNKYELAVRATGPSDDYVTVFYRYDCGKIKEIGRVGCIIDRDSTDSWRAYLSGNGTIRGERVLGVLEIRQVKAYWKLDQATDMLVLYEDKEYDYFFDDWVEPFVGWRREHPYELTGQILVYDQMDRTSKCEVVTGEDTRIIQFLSTDGRNWVKTEFFTDGEFKLGWIYIKDYIDIEVEKGKFAPGYECIKNLQGAG